MIPEIEGRQILAIATSKTSRAAGAKEYWLSKYDGSAELALAAAKEEHPRKKKWFALYQKNNDPLNVIARPFTA